MKGLIVKIRKTNFVEFMRGLTLLLVSLLLTSMIAPLAFIFNTIYYFVLFKWQSGLNSLGSWLKRIAISVDLLGNVVCGDMFAVLFTKRGGYHFGDREDTISYVLARNHYLGKLTFMGKFVVWILEKIDPGHIQLSIKLKIESDNKAEARLYLDEYWGKND